LLLLIAFFVCSAAADGAMRDDARSLFWEKGHVKNALICEEKRKKNIFVNYLSRLLHSYLWEAGYAGSSPQFLSHGRSAA
jgi:hypothetical protein